jgi:5-methylthioadenosine/S-adenosylhomocysteine deaminase
VILVDLNSARSQPVHRAISAIVYNASGADVRTVVVDGRILIDDGHLTVLDEKALLEECRAAARALVRRAGIA